MPNVTIALDKELLKKGRDYAQAHGTSLNDLIRTTLRAAIGAETNGEKKRDLSALWALAEKAIASAPKDVKPWKWNREELYDERTEELARRRDAHKNVR